MSVANSPTAIAKVANEGYCMDAETIILVVLVLFHKNALDSLSLVSFLQALAESNLASRFKLLIYDNSPRQSTLPDNIPVPFYFIHDPANGGLFGAYTAALQLAEKEGTEWLLLLDQDTRLHADYVRMLCLNIMKAGRNKRCAALVPKLLLKNKVISPARVMWGGHLSPVKEEATGFAPYEITALNSGALLRISAIRKVGGFKPIFWLDYLDHWLFNQLYRAHFLVYILDTALSHELSVKSMKNMSAMRYRNILSAEGEFYKCCKSRAENLTYLFRLIMRALKMLTLPDRHKLLPPLLTHLKKQIHPKESRSDGLLS